MPELPEVETVARQLEPELEGHAIEKLEVRDKRWSRPVRRTLGKQVDGRTILGLGRRGKYLLLGLDGEQTLVMHLRMTGNLVLVEGEGRSSTPPRGACSTRASARPRRSTCVPASSSTTAARSGSPTRAASARPS